MLPMPPPVTLAAAVAGCAWLVAPAGWPCRWLGLAWVLPVFLWPAQVPGPGELWVTALDVGQGMAIVLESAAHVVVFDAGPRYSAESDAGSRVLVPYLRMRGIRSVDVLVISHQDIDHAGGASALLRSLPVARVWTSVPTGHRLLAGANGVMRCEAGQATAVGALRLAALSPAPDLYDNARATTNARSCVILAQLGAHRVLLTDDVPARREEQIVRAQADLHVDLLVAPHHGSHTSSSEALVAATRARWASMQLGYRNHFNHPHAEVVQRYRTHGVQVVRSDESGAARWRFGADGGVTLERWRLDHARYWYNQPGTAPAP